MRARKFIDVLKVDAVGLINGQRPTGTLRRFVRPRRKLIQLREEARPQERELRVPNSDCETGFTQATRYAKSQIDLIFIPAYRGTC